MPDKPAMGRVHIGISGKCRGWRSISWILENVESQVTRSRPSFQPTCAFGARVILLGQSPHWAGIRYTLVCVMHIYWRPNAAQEYVGGYVGDSSTTSSPTRVYICMSPYTIVCCDMYAYICIVYIVRRTMFLAVTLSWPWIVPCKIYAVLANLGGATLACPPVNRWHALCYPFIYNNSTHIKRTMQSLDTSSQSLDTSCLAIDINTL